MFRELTKQHSKRETQAMKPALSFLVLLTYSRSWWYISRKLCSLAISKEQFPYRRPSVSTSPLFLRTNSTLAYHWLEGSLVDEVDAEEV